MTLEWSPDESVLKAYALRAGLTLQNFTDAAISGFVLHHDAKGLAQTEKQWVAALVGWVRNDLARAARTGKQGAQPQGGGIDDNDTSWLDGGTNE